MIDEAPRPSPPDLRRGRLGRGRNASQVDEALTPALSQGEREERYMIDLRAPRAKTITMTIPVIHQMGLTPSGLTTSPNSRSKASR